MAREVSGKKGGRAISKVLINVVGEAVETAG